jgi:hypothetical protein
MAVLPSVQDMGRRPVAQPQRGTARVSESAMSAQSTAFDALGRQVNQAGNTILDRVALNTARERDVQISDELRQMMYDPETGYMNTQGRNAVEARSALAERMQGLEEKYGSDLNNAARDRLIDSLRSRVNSATLSADNHLVGQTRAYEDGIANATIQSALNDAAVDPSSFQDKLLEAQNVARANLFENGMSTEEVNMKVEEVSRQFYGNELQRLTIDDPEGALSFLDENREAFGETYQTQRAQIEPLANQALGRRVATDAFSITPEALRHDTQIIHAEGRSRPNPPGAVITGLTGRAVQDVFGAGYKIRITSGSETHAEDEGENLPQHGAANHMTTHAMDFQVVDPEGNRVNMNSEDGAKFREQLAKLGVLGIGQGTQYMGDFTIHADIVDYGSGFRAWGATGDQHEAALRAASENKENDFAVAPGDRTGTLIRGGEAATETSTPSADNVARILQDLNAQDPSGRAGIAFLRQYEQMAGVVADQATAANDAMYGGIFAKIVAGQSVNDVVSPQDQMLLGPDRMSAIYEMERMQRTGQEVVSNRAERNRLELMSDQAFMRVDLSEYMDQLSATDLNRFATRKRRLLDEQNNPDRVVSRASPATIRSNIASGRYTSGLKEGLQQEVVGELSRWQDEFVAREGKAPTPTEMEDRAAFLATEISLDTSRFPFTQIDKNLVQMDMNGSTQTTDDDLTMDALTAAVEANGLDLAGERVTEDEWLRAVEEAGRHGGGVEATLRFLKVLKGIR